MRIESLPKGRYPGGTLVAAALESAGIRHAFGIPGTHNIELYDALAESDVIPVLVTDEQSAGFLADGSARSGGPVGCVNLVPGAGVTHALSGIAEAFLDNVPMLVLACGIRSDTPHRYQLHDVDQLALLTPLCKAVRRVERGEDLPLAVLDAVALARSGSPGPVALEVPANLYLHRHPWDPAVLHDREPEPADVATHDGAPSPADLRECLRLLGQMDVPLLHVGLGASEAADLLVPLAERLGAVVSTTFSGKGAFPESHPQWLWPGWGAACPPPLRKIARACDGALVLGARMGEVSTASYGVTLPRPAVHVDLAPEVLGATFAIDLGVVASVRPFVAELLGTLGRSGAPRDTTRLRAALAAAHAEVAAAQAAGSSGDRVPPHLLFRALRRAFPPETIFTTDSGNGTFLAVELLRVDVPRRLLAPTDFSCMGYAVPAAIGAALAHGRPTVAIPGDGALLMTGLELLTAARRALPVAVFVLRDGELGQIASFQRTLTNDAPCAVLPEIDLEALARAVGVPYLAMHGVADVDATIAEAVLRLQKGPVLVDVPIDYTQKTYFTRGVVRTNFGRLAWSDRLRMMGRAAARRVRPARRAAGVAQ